jgi:hypothetical protein
MTGQPSIPDPEASVENAELAAALRGLLRTETPSPASPAERAAEIRAVLDRAWPHGVAPFAPEGGDHHNPDLSSDPGHDAEAAQVHHAAEHHPSPDGHDASSFSHHDGDTTHHLGPDDHGSGHPS